MNQTIIMPVPFGSVARDEITGFTGVVTGHCVYITGCNQTLVQPRNTRDKSAEARWFDDSRLQIVARSRNALSPRTIKRLREGRLANTLADTSASRGSDIPAPII